MKFLKKFIKESLNYRLTREIWVKVYSDSMNEGNDAEFSKLAADNSVVAYNQKFVKLNVKLK